ncbi:MAG TPA: L-glutamate gamma-semialdehyde dehydrogenase [Kofleriaceae bacterium]
MDARTTVPTPSNEPVLDYAPGSAERSALEVRLAELQSERLDLTMTVGGQQRMGRGGRIAVRQPHAHRRILGTLRDATRTDAADAAAAAKAAAPGWRELPFDERAAVFLKAAELLSGPWRSTLNAATMLGQSKTAYQAEIDSACELIDFWRFNVQFAQDLYRIQPASSPGVWNMTELRPLEGFTFALTPFNFTAIAGNLPMAPALMGNTVVWKPAETQLLAAWQIYQLLEEAGLPPGVVNFIPGLPHASTNVVLDHPALAGIHFTGSTDVFRMMWKRVADNIDRYRSYPRLVGETGGKDFVLAHPSADPLALATAIVRGGYEYQGQKCSAASRIYVAKSVWDRMREPLIDTIKSLKVGDVANFGNFMGAVIKRGAFDKHQAAIAEARETPGMKVVAGGTCDDREGWFVQPTLITTENPGVRHMREEFFGPIVTLHVYPDAAWRDTLQLVDRTSPYALTGAIFARDRAAIVEATAALRDAAGNFYINDKPTGAVVGQQPFGGARASGTDDKAGSAANLMRFVAARTIKETFAPPTDWRYSFLDPSDRP